MRRAARRTRRARGSGRTAWTRRRRRRCRRRRSGAAGAGGPAGPRAAAARTARGRPACERGASAGPVGVSVAIERLCPHSRAVKRLCGAARALARGRRVSGAAAGGRVCAPSCTSRTRSRSTTSDGALDRERPSVRDDRDRGPARDAHAMPRRRGRGRTRAPRPRRTRGSRVCGPRRPAAADLPRPARLHLVELVRGRPDPDVEPRDAARARDAASCSPMPCPCSLARSTTSNPPWSTPGRSRGWATRRGRWRTRSSRSGCERTPGTPRRSSPRTSLPDERARVIAGLQAPGPYANAALAAAMRDIDGY